ncbi:MULTISPECIES: 3-hydroxyacyl-CoA dehydrogenase NAD-binding domain-containing protein [Marinobacter]|uniref:3-hydroxyacyl-CoA dehydrogenase NAD-binding domain-containing protein n=1 Tax=Marinobacter TaxID=2742 RepID=UPI0019085C19|nr:MULTISPECIES: 3-hydroxyacyl-CoA dehydrogenase NAD-binding domain-containing protein [unclassified Marinobacter]MBK1887886.1 enoyl-CoA hydratase/isomerase family protein [Marinobacter sp. DY40_1A1]
MVEFLNYHTEGPIAVISLNHPPVNSLGHGLRVAILQAYQNAISDSDVRAIVLNSSGRIFSGGADISELGSDLAWSEPALPHLCRMLEESPKPVIAAINGMALGGGFELALACDYRIAEAGAQLGLPEVQLGLIPGAGGTQRLPRLANPKMAVEMITSGKPVSAELTVLSGLIDEIADGDLADAAIQFANKLLINGAPVRSCVDIPVDIRELDANYFDDFRASLGRKTRGFYAPERGVQAVEAACRLPLTEGLAKEAELFAECLDTPQARAQQHLFFAEREARKIPGVDHKVPPRNIKQVAIIGAGTMGGGIAMNFANAGIQVKLLEQQEDALTHGLNQIRNNYEKSVEKGRITGAQVEERMALLQGTLSYEDLADADLVIEAVFESMEVKRAVFKKLDQVCKPGVILASNTSTLDLDAIADATDRPQDVIGLHFFSPANVMRLLEIVRGEKTSDDVIVTALNLARTINKQPIVVGVCYGFVGNRMLEPYAREANRLVLEGASPTQVDSVLTRFGLAMGPFSMFDLAGIDIGYMVREARRDIIAHDPSYCLISDKLCELGRYGQKTKRGFYLYQGRDKQENPEILELAVQIASELGIERREISDQEIYERCIYMLINEGANILQDGIAYRSGDCDLAWANGYGFPIWRGGPMQYADETGLRQILASIEKYRTALGAYGDMWFQPSTLLRKLVAEDKTFAQFQVQ